MKKWIVVLIVVLSSGLVGGMGYWGYLSSQTPVNTPPPKPSTVAASTCDVQQSISAPGSVTGTREQTLQMPADGELAEIRVQAGQAVKKGELLARLQDPQKFAAAEAEARLALLEAERQLEEVKAQAPLKTAEAHAALLEAQKKLDKAKTGRLSKSYQRASDETIDVARANLMLAAAELDQAEEVYEIHKGRDDADPEKAAALSALARAKQEYYRHEANLNWLLTGPTDLEIEQADTAIAVAQAEYDTALAAWERVKDGPDGLLLRQAEAKIDQASAKLELAQSVYASVEIRAPFNGVVVEVKVRAGEPVAGGAGLMTLVDPAALEVLASVVEEELPLVAEGMAVDLFFDALPEETLTGRVTGIIPRRVGGDSPRYEIRIALDQVPSKLVSGMTVDASLVIQERQGVLCLPRGVVRSSGGDQANVKVWNGSAAENRTITVGLRGDQDVEILAGLSEGEEVVLK